MQLRTTCSGTNAVQTPSVTSAPADATAAECSGQHDAVEDTHLALPGTVRIGAVAELYARLQPLAQNAAPVTVDVFAVESMDTAAYQLLAAFANERQQRSRGVTWHGPSEAFCSGAHLLGLDSQFGLQDGEPA